MAVKRQQVFASTRQISLFMNRKCAGHGFSFLCLFRSTLLCELATTAVFLFVVAGTRTDSLSTETTRAHWTAFVPVLLLKVEWLQESS